MEILFWTALALVLYGYVGYPLALGVLACWRGRPPRAHPITPPVTMIVTVHNGETAIQAKLANCLTLDYPPERLEILVASDGSTDRTNDLVARYHDPRVRLIALEQRRGKEAAQREAIARATGEILVFTDAGVRLPTDALRALIANFADPTIGCASGVDHVVNAGDAALAEGAFVRYETLVKRLESRIGSTVGNSGWFFAVRRSLSHLWPHDMASDFTILLRVVREGMRGVVEPRATAYAQATSSSKREFQRKVRTMVRGMVVLASHKEMLNPFRHGVFTLELLSHKLFRWCLPLLLILMLLTSAVLAPRSAFYAAALLAQVAFYALGGLAPRARIPYYLVSGSVAAVVAWWKFLAGERFVVWDPTPRIREVPR